MRIVTPLITLLLYLCFTGLVFSQDYAAPMRIKPLLSSNFGELRNNHFHSGIDYKTQQTINKPIYSIGDGYVSRINISPGGYGLAIYIDHPEGYTSVYAHLNAFPAKIDEYIVNKQYELESYRIDIKLRPEELPVKKGELIAMSGNTGSSGGAHLHFEIRDTKTEEVLDVLEFLGKTITDTRKPDLRGIAFYPKKGEGVVNGGSNPIRMNIGKTKSGNYASISSVQAWGNIGLGVKGYDLMTGTNNIYGVKHVRLYADGNLIFSSSISRFPFDKTRMLNSFVDFEDWRLRKSFYMKSFVEPGNTLPFYNMEQDGYLKINQERVYHMRYELEDNYGNMTSYSFSITGKKQNIPTTNCSNLMKYNVNNKYSNRGLLFSIPIGNLYTDFCFSHNVLPTDKFLSAIHQINNRAIPLHKSGQIWIQLRGNKSIADSTRMGIVKIARNGSESWIGGTFKNNGVEASINELGDKYAIDIDSEKPVISPVNKTQWISQKKISIKLSDAKSGIKSFRGEIDGQFVLFRHDIKSNIYTYSFDKRLLKNGLIHDLTFNAEDNTGNKSTYSSEFVY